MKGGMGPPEERKMNEYKIEGENRVYTHIAEARKARAAIRAGRMSDAVVSILRKEECAPVLASGEPEFMWVPYE